MSAINEMDGIIDDFCVESDEMIELTNEDLLDIENSYSEEKINRIFRTFHTIKGNSAMLGFDNLSAFTHRAEDLLTKIRSSEIMISKEIIDLLLQVTDFILDSINNIRKSLNDIKKIDESLLNKIKEIINSDNVKTSKTEKIEISKTEKKEKGKKLKFLIVDDDFINRTILNKTLTKFGECNIAVDGKEAVYAFMLSFEENAPYDIIFMDINMPNMNGIDASLKIREIEKEKGIFGRKEVRIIIVSTINDPRKIIRTIYKCGATSYITKPYEIERIKKELGLLKLI